MKLFVFVFLNIIIMPFIETNGYKPPFFFRNRHINTIAPSLFRKTGVKNGVRESLETWDHDFIDFDFYGKDNSRAVIMIHGLEGNSRKAYMQGVTKVLLGAGFDVFALNLRGCSDQPNHLLSSYHSGKTDDLDFFIKHMLDKYSYKQLVLIGFSLGGNIVLKYVGENAQNLSAKIKAAIGISVPCDLAATSRQLEKLTNRIYLWRFLKSLKKKAIYKIEYLKTQSLTKKEIVKAINFNQFDNIFTAPVHGFANAQDYWEKSSCKQFLPNIRIPALLLNAADDPFLPDECYPIDEAEQNPNLLFEMPKYGGHVGFVTDLKFMKNFWHEKRILEFLKDIFSRENS